MSNPLGRGYTPREVSALKRLGLFEIRWDGPSGVAVSATGNYWPRYARKQANDWAVATRALEREFQKDTTVDTTKHTTPAETEEL